MQRALALSELEYSDNELLEALGVDPHAIHARHEKAAREAHKVQTSAQPKSGKPAKPARAKKGGAR